jgi:hypothetical protein
MKRFRVTFDPCVDDSTTPFVAGEVETVAEAIMQLDLLADYTLLLHEKSLMTDYSNYGFIEEFVDGRWVIVDDDE